MAEQPPETPAKKTFAELVAEGIARVTSGPNAPYRDRAHIDAVIERLGILLMPDRARGAIAAEIRQLRLEDWLEGGKRGTVEEAFGIGMVLGYTGEELNNFTRLANEAAGIAYKYEGKGLPDNLPKELFGKQRFIYECIKGAETHVQHEHSSAVPPSKELPKMAARHSEKKPTKLVQAAPDTFSTQRLILSILDQDGDLLQLVAARNKLVEADGLSPGLPRSQLKKDASTSIEQVAINPPHTPEITQAIKWLRAEQIRLFDAWLEKTRRIQPQTAFESHGRG